LIVCWILRHDAVPVALVKRVEMLVDDGLWGRLLFRRLGGVGGDAPGLVAREQLGGRVRSTPNRSRPHSITSSARTSREAGISISSVFALWRLTVSLIVVGW
jgi:hypothetical protein